MKTSTAVVILVVALVGAFVLSLSVYRYMQRQPPVVVVEHEKTRQIVVASANLSLGTRLGEDNLRLVAWPEKNPPIGYFTRIEDVRNRVLLHNVLENEPILAAKLTAADAKHAGLPPIIKEGRRAFSIRVNDVINVAGYATPGTTVDVLVTGTPVGTRGPQTKTILQGIPVLTAGQQIEYNPDGKPIANIQVVTLEVTPEEAERLSLASTEGKIQLALRNPIDVKVESTPGAEFVALFKGRAEPAPAKPRAVRPKPTPVKKPEVVAPPPKPAVTLEVLNGGKKSTYTF